MRKQSALLSQSNTTKKSKGPHTQIHTTSSVRSEKAFSGNTWRHLEKIQLNKANGSEVDYISFKLIAHVKQYDIQIIVHKKGFLMFERAKRKTILTSKKSQNKLCDLKTGEEVLHHQEGRSDYKILESLKQRLAEGDQNNLDSEKISPITRNALISRNRWRKKKEQEINPLGAAPSVQPSSSTPIKTLDITGPLFQQNWLVQNYWLVLQHWLVVQMITAVTLHNATRASSEAVPTRSLNTAQPIESGNHKLFSASKRAGSPNTSELTTSSDLDNLNRGTTLAPKG